MRGYLTGAQDPPLNQEVDPLPRTAQPPRGLGRQHPAVRHSDFVDPVRSAAPAGGSRHAGPHACFLEQETRPFSLRLQPPFACGRALRARGESG
jgi:hypothetical protein